MNIKFRLTLLSFLQFFVWGAWLITIGVYWFETKQWSGAEFGAISVSYTHLDVYKRQAPMLAVIKNAALISNAVAAPESVSPFQVKRKSFSGKAFMIAQAEGNNVIAVSYTHLDVYKRQS